MNPIDGQIPARLEEVARLEEEVARLEEEAEAMRHWADEAMRHWAYGGAE